MSNSQLNIAFQETLLNQYVLNRTIVDFREIHYDFHPGKAVGGSGRDVERAGVAITCKLPAKLHRLDFDRIADDRILVQANTDPDTF